MVFNVIKFLLSKKNSMIEIKNLSVNFILSIIQLFFLLLLNNLKHKQR